jgi:hypothetical protein
MDAISAARTGVLSAVQGFDGASADFANAFTRHGGENAASAAVSLINGRNGVRASIAALKAAVNTQKALLDIKV